jgi:rhamnosyltransferase
VRSEVCAVVVTFNPDAGVTNRLAHVLSQVGRLVLVDNSTDPSAALGLDDLAGDTRVELIRNGENRGVAAALNQGIGRAAARGHAWAWTLDQDSHPRADMLERLFEVYAEAPSPHAVAMVGVDHANSGSWQGAEPGWRGETWRERKSVITSGSLLPTAVWRRLGPFCESFFIDHVDTEYCLRARSQGYRVLAILEPLMEHAIGAPSSHPLGWRMTTTSNHPPSRRFYMSRNLVTVVRVYGATEPAWAAGAVWSWCKSMVLMLWFERNRTAKLRAALRGVLAGRRMKCD